MRSRAHAPAAGQRAGTKSCRPAREEPAPALSRSVPLLRRRCGPARRPTPHPSAGGAGRGAGGVKALVPARPRRPALTFTGPRRACARRALGRAAPAAVLLARSGPARPRAGGSARASPRPPAAGSGPWQAHALPVPGAPLPFGADGAGYGARGDARGDRAPRHSPEPPPPLPAPGGRAGPRGAPGLSGRLLEEPLRPVLGAVSRGEGPHGSPRGGEQPHGPGPVTPAAGIAETAGQCGTNS